jgi:hypothetical protein
MYREDSGEEDAKPYRPRSNRSKSRKVTAIDPETTIKGSQT